MTEVTEQIQVETGQEPRDVQAILSHGANCQTLRRDRISFA